MSGPDVQGRKRDARRRLQAQRRRAGELRARAVAISVVAFALLWGIVFVQMATGHDPVLSNKPKATASGREEARLVGVAPAASVALYVFPVQSTCSGQSLRSRVLFSDQINYRYAAGRLLGPEPALTS